ncbi:hypothetical protein J2W17_003718 [Pseudomonas lini]|jgi:hypothetical protein|nr:hypothetical protein [Pseudomonas lini]MDQ0124764.1 hypothetical protein [Pseudomonas lini]
MTYFKKLVAAIATFTALSASFALHAEESGALVDRNKALNERAVGS